MSTMDGQHQSDSDHHCKKCDQVDDSHMVQCDKCDLWYHYDCVGVNSDIADVSWSCGSCNPLSAAVISSSNAPPTYTQNNVPQKVKQIQPQATSSPQTACSQFHEANNTFAPSDIDKPVKWSNGQVAKETVEIEADVHKKLTERNAKLLESAPMLNLRTITQAKPMHTNVPNYNNVAPSEYNVAPHCSDAALSRYNAATNVYNVEKHTGFAKHSQQHLDLPKNTQQHSLFTFDAQQHFLSNSQPAARKEENAKTLELRLAMLEEETKLQRSYLEEKYRILSQAQGISSIKNNICVQSTPTKMQLAARQAIPRELPHFHGDPEEWPLFISSFETSTEVAGYTNAENLMRLQACIKGKAREMVRSKLLLPAMVPEIIHTLRMCFGRPEYIIENLIEKVRKVPLLKDRLDTFIDFALSVRNVYSTMEACRMDAYMNNPMLVRELVEKLPNQYKMSWAMHPKQKEEPLVKVFSDWLYALAEAASQVVSPTTKKSSGHVNTHVQAQNVQQKYDCENCKSNGHKIAQCEEFKKLSIDCKWDVVRSLKLCRQCLNTHRRRCLVNRVCGIESCNAKHHQLLHRSRVTCQPITTIAGVASVATVNSHNNAHKEDYSFFRILPVRIYAENNFFDTFAFLDEGSSVTLIDEEVFKQLNLKGVLDPLCLRWTGDTTRSEDSSMRTILKVANLQTGDCFTMQGVHTVNNLGLPIQTVEMEKIVTQYPYLAGLPIQSYVDAKPTILIGSNNWHLAVPLKVREGAWNQPIATKTRLGWALQGRCSNQPASTYLNIHTCSCSEKYEHLHDLVKEYYKLDAPSPTQLLSQQDKRAMEILDTTCKKVGSRFETGLLWRYDHIDFPESYGTAFQRMICLERKFCKDPSLKAAMQQQIDNLLNKGYARRLTTEELHARTDRVWYLPIFTTKNPNKPDRVRLVWDAATKTKGISLNDMILSGPDLLTPLVEILLGFRLGRVAICGDISEMFHQINVRSSDMHAQRFLWCDKEDSIDSPGVYVMRALTFGISCAPCIAHYVRNKNADEFAQKFPRAVDAIKKHHYVDDFIDSEHSEQAALKLATAVRNIHAAAGFHIRNWSSNSKFVLTHLNADQSVSQEPVELSNSEKILGVYWDPKKDVFKYALRFARLKRNVLSNDVVPTKRELLQVLMSIFDPLGFVAQYTISLKILLQEVWRASIDWDEALPDELMQKWSLWKTSLKQIAAVEIPRSFSNFLNEADDVELHTFVDAGEYGYSAVCYLRVRCGNNINVSLVAAKSKVTPLKPVSIPRLELQAAIIGVRLANQAQCVPGLPLRRKVFWTDSATVLKWLRMDPRQFQQFVMYRVAEILEHTNLDQWKWVPSTSNPADLATKSEPKTSDHLWYNGPDFLMNAEEEWPYRDDFGPTNTSEIRHHLLLIQKTDKQKLRINTEYFSSWRRLYRALGMFIFYLEKLRAKIRPVNATPQKPTFEMIQAAKTILIKQAQLSEYSQEIIAIKSDEQDIIRVKGRTEFLNPHDVIVLPNNSHITYLIVKEMHEQYHHLSHETLINDIKGQYLIPRLRVLYRSVRSSCQHCKNKNVTTLTPQMAALPAARLASFERPFTYVGVDYFGPMFAVVGRRREKRWGVIFTCLTVRAVHIEVAHSLDTSSCILCIRNFISRRGVPKEIYTDNGTNFKATAKILQEEARHIDYMEIAAKFDAIQWKFNPPAAPHMGGAWERLIRSIKNVLNAMYPEPNFNDETLRSALFEVEYIINSRPLTFVSLESCDDEAITPNHLLLGSASGYKPIGHSGDLRHRYHQTRIYADRFWQRWLKEYTPELTRRSKWYTKQPPLKVGNVVIIVDENQPRNKWPKGIVQEVVSAKDGQVRRATVKTQYGLLERPAVKLAVLDVGNPKE